MPPLALLAARPVAWTRPMRRRTRRVTTRAASRATGAGASTRAGTGKKHGGSEGGDEGTAGFGVDAATLRELCEATPGEGRVARIRDLGGLHELARALRSNLRDGLAVTSDPADARGEDAATVVVVVADRDARIDAFGANVVPSRDAATFYELLLRALNDDTLKILVACGALSLTLELGSRVPTTRGLDRRSRHPRRRRRRRRRHRVQRRAEAGAVRPTQRVRRGRVSRQGQARGSRRRRRRRRRVSRRFARARRGRRRPRGLRHLVHGRLRRGGGGRVAPHGESDDVRKTSAGAPVLLGGSKILEGRCEAMVVAVGANSQAGLVTAMVRGQDGGGGVSATKTGKTGSGIEPATTDRAAFAFRRR